jgi:hypothetical protein
MTIWSGIGMNYGYQRTYSGRQADADLNNLYANGVTRVRIVFPDYRDTVRISYGQDMVSRALAKGFYVIWGVDTGDVIDDTMWADYKNYVLNTLLPWASTHSLSELCLGNEFELRVDGTTMTTPTIRDDIRSMASIAKSKGFAGKLSYSTSCLQTYRTPWINEGLGVLDLIGWNSYDTVANFNTRNSAVVAAFGNRTYISEFGGISYGYPDFGDEQAYYTDTLNRISSMQSTSIVSGYSFCYRDGGYGVPPNSFGLIQTNGVAHLALNAVYGKAA